MSNEERLLSAVQDGDVDQVKQLLADGADVNASTDDDTPLAAAAREDDCKMLQLLVDSKAVVDQAAPLSNHTALIAAVDCGCIQATKWLLEHKASVNATAAPLCMRTPLMFTVEAESTDVAAALLDAQADIDARESFGFTTLMEASVEGFGEMIKLLLERKANASFTATRGLHTGKTAAQLVPQRDELLQLFAAPPPAAPPAPVPRAEVSEAKASSSSSS